jgi:hypothetical protein
VTADDFARWRPYTASLQEGPTTETVLYEGNVRGALAKLWALRTAEVTTGISHANVRLVAVEKEDR